MKKIQDAIHTFIGEKPEDITPDMVLERIRYELQDPNFQAEIDILGHEISVDGVIFSISYHF